jgi:hypothetical protein
MLSRLNLQNIWHPMVRQVSFVEATHNKHETVNIEQLYSNGMKNDLFT